jgi:hypothetical protein
MILSLAISLFGDSVTAKLQVEGKLNRFAAPDLAVLRASFTEVGQKRFAA